MFVCVNVWSWCAQPERQKGKHHYLFIPDFSIKCSFQIWEVPPGSQPPQLSISCSCVSQVGMVPQTDQNLLALLHVMSGQSSKHSFRLSILLYFSAYYPQEKQVNFDHTYRDFSSDCAPGATALSLPLPTSIDIEVWWQ